MAEQSKSRAARTEDDDELPSAEADDGSSGDDAADVAVAKEDRAPAKKKAKGGKGAPKTMVSIEGLTKSYYRGTNEVRVLDGLDLQIAAGSYEALMGPSGSGKTTLLNLIAGLDRPTSGTLKVAGVELAKLGEGALAEWRAANVGFVFQSYNLMPVLTAAQNVELPLLLTHLSAKERAERVKTALRVVGLENRSNHYPRELSGGQEQRVTIARAIVSDPAILIADEPTGDLDRKSAEEILELLSLLHTDFGKTIVMVTHDPHAAERAQVQHHLNKGRLE